MTCTTPGCILCALRADIDGRYWNDRAARDTILHVIDHQHAKGLAKYGRVLTKETPVDFKRYALEEAVDLMAYLEADGDAFLAKASKDHIFGLMINLAENINTAAEIRAVGGGA